MVEEEVVPEISTGSGGKKKIIVIALVALAALIAAFFIVKTFVLSPGGEQGKGKGGKKAEQLKEEAKKQNTLETLVGPSIPIESIIVNLADRDARKFLKIKLELELISADPTLKSEAEKRMPKIRDSIITYLSTKTSEQMLAPEGKTLLREDIIQRINNGVLETGKIRNIYITDFVVQ